MCIVFNPSIQSILIASNFRGDEIYRLISHGARRATSACARLFAGACVVCVRAARCAVAHLQLVFIRPCLHPKASLSCARSISLAFSFTARQLSVGYNVVLGSIPGIRPFCFGVICCNFCPRCCQRGQRVKKVSSIWFCRCKYEYTMDEICKIVVLGSIPGVRLFCFGVICFNFFPGYCQRGQRVKKVSSIRFCCCKYEYTMDEICKVVFAFRMCAYILSAIHFGIKSVRLLDC